MTSLEQSRKKTSSEMQAIFDRWGLNPVTCPKYIINFPRWMTLHARWWGEMGGLALWQGNLLCSNKTLIEKTIKQLTIKQGGHWHTLRWIPYEYYVLSDENWLKAVESAYGFKDFLEDEGDITDE